MFAVLKRVLHYPWSQSNIIYCITEMFTYNFLDAFLVASLQITYLQRNNIAVPVGSMSYPVSQ